MRTRAVYGEEVAVQTDVAWSSKGFMCRNCSRPPLNPGGLQAADAARAMVVGSRAERRKLKRGKPGPLDGTWTIVGDHQEDAAQWLFRLYFSGAVCLDNNGRNKLLHRWEDKLYLEGGLLQLEGWNLLHRDGRSGRRFTFARGDGGHPMGVPISLGQGPELVSPLRQLRKQPEAPPMPLLTPKQTYSTPDECSSEEEVSSGEDCPDNMDENIVLPSKVSRICSLQEDPEAEGVDPEAEGSAEANASAS